MIQYLLLETNPAVGVLTSALIIDIIKIAFVIFFLYLAIKTMYAICGIERQLKVHNDREYEMYRMEYIKFRSTYKNMNPEDVLKLMDEERNKTKQ